MPTTLSKTQGLANRIALHLVCSDESAIIAAGPITKQPGTRPYRITMQAWGGTISVHSQIYEIDGEVEDLATACENARSCGASGEYFKAEELEKATLCFCRRLKQDVANYESIYRQ